MFSKVVTHTHTHTHTHPGKWRSQKALRETRLVLSSASQKKNRRRRRRRVLRETPLVLSSNSLVPVWTKSPGLCALSKVLNVVPET